METRGQRLFEVGAVAVLAVMTVALLGGGISLAVQRQSGTPVKVQVDHCTQHGGRYTARTDCTGAAIVGGDLVFGNGHVVVGQVQGADSSDAGKTINGKVSNGTLHTTSMVLPIILIGLGLLVAAGTVIVGRALLWPRARGGPEEASA